MALFNSAVAALAQHQYVQRIALVVECRAQSAHQREDSQQHGHREPMPSAVITVVVRRTIRLRRLYAMGIAMAVSYPA